MAPLDENLPACLALLREGHRPATVARKLGLTRQAIYMRMKRDPTFRAAVREAEAAAETTFLMKLQACAIKGKSWQAFAWILERRFGWLSASDSARNVERKIMIRAERAAKNGASTPEKWQAAVRLIPGMADTVRPTPDIAAEPEAGGA